MKEYIVEDQGIGYRYVPDSPEPDKEPHTHYWKKPLTVRITERCNERAKQGWTLVHVVPRLRQGGWANTLYFERDVT